MWFYKANGVYHIHPPFSGLRALAQLQGERKNRVGGCQRVEPEGLDELRSLRIRKVRIREFLLHFWVRMCHFQSKPLVHTCFCLRIWNPMWPGS